MTPSVQGIMSAGLGFKKRINSNRMDSPRLQILNRIISQRANLHMVTIELKWGGCDSFYNGDLFTTDGVTTEKLATTELD
jgi:hypothetical protein